MSEEIIKVVDYIGTQLGIAIDWTAENVFPQVMDVLRRYRIFQIINCILPIIGCVCITIVFIVIWRTVIKLYKSCEKEHNKNFWWYYSSYHNEIRMEGQTEALIAATIVWIILIFMAFIFSEGALLSWIFVPEIKYLELLKGYIP